MEWFSTLALFLIRRWGKSSVSVSKAQDYESIHSVFLLNLSLCSARGFAQAPPIVGNTQSTSVDRTEILGRLALAYSPGYEGSLVETRGVSFTPSAKFKLEVRDGILVERLYSV